MFLKIIAVFLKKCEIPVNYIFSLIERAPPHSYNVNYDAHESLSPRAHPDSVTGTDADVPSEKAIIIFFSDRVLFLILKYNQ